MTFSNGKYRLNQQEKDITNLYPKAVELVQTAGKVSTAQMREELSIGSSVIERLLDKMEHQGIIQRGPGGKRHVVRRDITA